MAPLQESIQAQVSPGSVSLIPQHGRAPRPLRRELTPPSPTSLWPLQEKNLMKAYAEVAAVCQQQLHQLEFAGKILEKVWG